MGKSILFIDQYANIGGGQRSMIALLRVARASGYAPAVLAPSGGLLEEEIASDFVGAVKFHALPAIGLTKGTKGIADALKILPFTLAVVANLWKLRRIRIRYFNGPRAYLGGFLASFLWYGRSIYHVRIDHSRVEKHLLRLIQRWGRSSTLIFNSPFLLSRYLAFTGEGTAPANCRVIENSLYPPYDSLPFVDRFTDRSLPLTIGVFGRICPDKGQDQMIALAQTCKDVRILLFGVCEPADQGFLENILAQGSGRIEYKGFVDDVVDAVNTHSIQVSVVPSRWEEAFGLVAVESMAMSCITIVSDRGMLPEIARQTGAFSFADPSELAGIIQSIVNESRGVNCETARRQHRSATEIFAFARFSDQIQQLLAGH